ncbi:family 10 glycosylhydrolase [bacterium]|nr:family 10 glycosylhydrolase [bacterium]
MLTSRFVSALVALTLVGALGAPALAGPLETQLSTLRDRHTRLETRLAQAKSRMLDVPVSRAEVDLTVGKMALDTASLLIEMREDPKRVQEWLDKARDRLDASYLGTSPSRGVEARGLFIDMSSLPKTQEGIRELVERLSRANFNMIIPEVFRRGYTLYPSRFTDKDPEFAKLGFDPFRTLVSEAHRAGIEVHPWIWTFRVKSPGFGDPVLSRLPALAARGPKTADPRFLSPGDPRAREWVFGLVDELTDRYDVDGLLLDYIRYDEETPDDWISQTSFGLDYYARHGAFPPSPLKPNSPAWVEYQLWREQQVNLTVQTLAQRLKLKNPNLQLSVSTFRGERYGRLNKMQHWRHWSNNGWTDFVTSMLYTSKTSDLGTWLNWETDNGTRTNLLYAILGPHRMDDPIPQTLEQIEYLNQRQSPAVLFFALAHLKPGMLEALEAGPFRKPAMNPGRKLIPAARRVLAELDNSYLGQVQAAADPGTAASVAVVRGELKKLQRSLPLTATPYYQNAALLDRLEAIKASARQMTQERVLSAPVGDEIAQRLDYAAVLVKANAQRLGATRFVPTSPPPASPMQPEAPEQRD